MEIEVWKQIPGYSQYEISTLGNVRWTGPSGTRQLKPFKTEKGYLKVNFNQKFFFVHRLVLSTFVGPSELECNHLNGVKTDNRRVNLEYVTKSENIRHAIRTGLKRTKQIQPGAPKGSLNVSACTHHISGWRLRRTYYVNGKRCQVSPSQSERVSLGFDDELTLEQARTLAKLLNANKRKGRTK